MALYLKEHLSFDRAEMMVESVKEGDSNFHVAGLPCRVDRARPGGWAVLVVVHHTAST